MKSNKTNEIKKSNDVKEIADYLLAFYDEQKEHTIIDNDDEDLDIAIGMNNLRFQKILYFAYGFYYSETKKELFDADFKAYKHGPIIDEIFKINNQATNKNGYMNIPPKTYAKSKTNNLIVKFEILDRILYKLEQFSTWTLVGMSHEPGSPWSRTKQSEIIKKNLVKSYFRNLELG